MTPSDQWAEVVRTAIVHWPMPARVELAEYLETLADSLDDAQLWAASVMVRRFEDWHPGAQPPPQPRWFA